MKRPQNLIGERFFKLKVIKFLGKGKRTTIWLCQCDCGNERICERSFLISKSIRSCGCQRVFDYEFDHEERFFKYVIKSEGCWIWSGCKDKKGYGQFNLKNKTMFSHRFSYELKYGKIPEKMCVCHKCDTPSCVNPDHLFLGTNKENLRDMISKGRKIVRKGVEKNNSKMNDEKVKKMRELYDNGNTVLQLSKLFQISESSTYYICKRKSWKHVK